LVIRGFMTSQAFSSGDRVLVDGKPGTIVNIFPDGIHMVRLDETGRVVAATVSQLSRANAHGSNETGSSSRHGASVR
jgi:hypothetical protein